MAHAAERSASYYLALQWGSHVHYVRDLEQLGTQLPAVRPAFLMAVPRVWEKFAAAMKSATSEGGPRAALGAAALDTPPGWANTG